MTTVSEKTKIALGSGFALAVGACTVWASVSVSMARTDAAIASQNKRLDYNTEARDRLIDKVSAIDSRTARIEGMLEQMRDANESRHR